MWEEREAITKLVNLKLQNEFGLVKCQIKYMETIIELINDNKNKENITLLGIIFTKSYLYSKGIISLFYENLALEAGALIRPAIEAYELLVYLRKYPENIKTIQNGQKIEPGKIAKKIDGTFKPLRDYLNKHSSHIDISELATNYFIDNDKNIVCHFTISSDILHDNFMFLSTILYLLSFEGAKILEKYQLLDGNGKELLVKLQSKLYELYDLKKVLGQNADFIL